jgi:ABC-2 type transport system ATP-binding protein
MAATFLAGNAKSVGSAFSCYCYARRYPYDEICDEIAVFRLFVIHLPASGPLEQVKIPSGGPTTLALTISGLSKTYPNGVKALKNVSLNIGKHMFGLLGPNGAGKSTLMRTVATLQDPDSGSVKLDDIDVLKQKNEVRKVLGYLPQEFGVYPKMSAIDMLQHLAVMKGITSSKERKEMIDELLQQTNLWDVRKKALSTFSGGMKQRFGIAQALLANPRLIIVDEPTAGLDPAERNRFLNLLSSIGREVTVILSTHIVDDVRELCPRMAIIANGEVLLEGAPAESLSALHGKIWSKVVASDDELRALESQISIVSTHLVGGQHEIRVYSDSNPGEGFRAVESGLEDVYFLNLSKQAKN